MDDNEVYKIIKDELNHYMIFSPKQEDIARRILDKIKIYIKEEQYLRRENRIKRIISYRILALISEWLIFYLLTGNLEISLVGTVITCIGLHSILHYIVDKVFE